MRQALPYLFFLACPVSMGLMMWYMMRSQRGMNSSSQESPDVRIARLEREIELLRTEHDQALQDEERPAS